jgi:single-stranded-DNA-specific exonuclease
LKIVAIATIADAVPLAGENRIFAKLGLEGLRTPVNPGLKALLEVAQLPGNRPPTSGEVAFRIAPRLNAAGRMDVARDVIELFSVRETERARELASRLDQLNAERQQEEKRILESIELRLREDATLRDAFCMVIDGDGWHRGVIGITATRVVERYCRPALVVSRDGEQAHGSGRSIPAFHLLNALESCGGLFTRFGGHAHAVGFSLPAARLPELRQRLDTYARSCLTLADFEPVLNFDAELPLDRVTPELFQVLRRLEPFGIGNPEPLFGAYGVRVIAPPRVMKDTHIKLKLAPSLGQEPEPAAVIPRCHPDSAALPKRGPDGTQLMPENRGPRADSWRKAVTFDALAWHMAERIQQSHVLAGDTLDIVYSLDQNEHPEFGGLELSLRDFRTTTERTSAQPAAAAAIVPE